MVATTFPLQWPEGWSRTPRDEQQRAPYRVTQEKAQRDMLWSLSHLQARGSVLVISSNIPVTRNGTPYTNHRHPEDPGVAVYWTNKAGEDCVMACDRWAMVYENIRAIGRDPDYGSGVSGIRGVAGCQSATAAFVVGSVWAAGGGGYVRTCLKRTKREARDGSR